MSEILFVEYARCSTCRKAKKWLDEHNISYIDRPIKEENPSAEEIKAWHKLSGLPIKRFFNTSGKLYRELGVKDKFAEGMSDEEAYQLLATDGMLVKRPVLVSDEFAVTGFKEDVWAELLGISD